MLTVTQATTKARPTTIPKACRFLMMSSSSRCAAKTLLADALEAADHLLEADLLVGLAVHYTYTKKRRFLHQVLRPALVDGAVEGEGVVVERADDAQLRVAEAADEPHPERARPARGLLSGADDRQVVHGLQAERLRHALAGHGFDLEKEALGLAVGDDQVPDLAADNAGDLAEGDLVGELLHVEVEEIDVERDRPAGGERLGDGQVAQDDLAAEDAGLAAAGDDDLVGADLEAREVGLDLAGQLELGRLDGELRDVDVAQDDRPEPTERAGRGVEAERRLAELEAAA